MKHAKTSRVERLARRDEKSAIKRIIYLSLLSFILAILLFTIGVPFLGKLADFLNLIFKNKDNTQSINNSFLAPPRIDQLPEVTNSAKLAVSGFSDQGTIVDIYLNDEKIGSVEVKNGKFIFENLNLKDGKNKITVKAKANSEESKISPTETVLLDTEKPKLEIERPFDGQSFSQNNRIKVSGRTDLDAQIYANNFLANVDSAGKFEVLVPVPEGESIIEIRSVDKAGNTRSEIRKISYKN